MDSVRWRGAAKPWRRRLGLALAGLIGLLLAVGCDLVARQGIPNAMPQPATTSAPALEVTATATQTRAAATSASSPVMTATPLALRTLAPLPSAAPSPTPASAKQLVYARLGNIFRGGAWGEEPQLAASGAELESWHFRDGLLANAQLQRVQVFDLNHGVMTGFDAPLSQEVIYAQALWGEAGQALLYAAAIEDAQAPRLGRSVLLIALEPQEGRELGRATLRDVAGVTLLRYDEASQQAMLIPFGEDEDLTAVERYDLSTGQRVASVTIAGQGEAALSPDGRWLLTQHLDAHAGRQALWLTDLAEETPPRSLWECPADSHAVSLLWSPDGRSIAFLLRNGLHYYEASEGRGLWVLDVASGEARQALDLSALNAQLLGWSPDGASILGYQRDWTDSGFHFAVRPDGGDYRILGLDAEAQVLGWMARPTIGAAAITVDLWQGRIAATRGDAAALAQAVAEFVIAYRDQGLEATQQSLETLLRDAGWDLALGQPGLSQVEEDLWLASLPPLEIYALTSSGAQALAQGNLVLEARLDGNDLGLIYGVIGASSVQPAYILYRRDAEGRWQPLWTPQGRQDWVATDGEIRFVGQGLSVLEVRGTSFGLDNDVFHECHACLHRRLVGRWVRQGDAYARQPELSPGVAIEAVYWEMTERTPYAVLYEFLWRVRQNLPVVDLASDARLVSEARTLGLAGDALLLAEEERDGKVYFGDIEGKQRFIAEVQNGKLVAILTAP